MTDCSKCRMTCCGNCANIADPEAMKSTETTIICKVLPKGREGKEGIAPRTPCKLWEPRT